MLLLGLAESKGFMLNQAYFMSSGIAHIWLVRRTLIDMMNYNELS